MGTFIFLKFRLFMDKNTLKLITVGTAVGFALTMGMNAWADKTDTATQNQLPLKEIRQFTDVFGAIKSFYVDPVGDKKLLEQALTGMVSGLDPHSAYLDAEGFKDLQEGTEGEFGGLGIEVTKDGKSGVQVVSPIDDTPAAKAGVRAGDIIIKIDNTFTYDLTLSKCVKMMRGKPKTPVTLQIMRKGVKKPITIKLVRSIIKVQSVKAKELPDGIGYIRISQFQEHTEEDLAKALNKFQKDHHLKGLVLDLRNNPGGLLDAAVGVCGLFLPANTLVVSTKGRTEDSNREFFTGQPLPNLPVTEKGPEEAKTVPIVVLINPSSASASEIVAGALQDHKRATLMGRRSFGKGSVQTVIPLTPLTEKSPTGIKLTTARYYTPSGRSIQATGIKPDVAVNDTAEGNYPSFIIREADLDNHLTVSGNSTDTDEAKEEAESETASDKDVYKFGDDNDFPLQQAQHFLKGEPVKKGGEHAAKASAKSSQPDAKKTTERSNETSSKNAGKSVK